MKRIFGLQFTAMICCFAMMMSCTDDDTKGQLTPEEKEKAEFFEKIKDPRIDYSVAEILGCVRAYEFNEDGTFNAASIVGWDDKGWIAQNSFGSFWGDKSFFKIEIFE